MGNVGAFESIVRCVRVHTGVRARALRRQSSAVEKDGFLAPARNEAYAKVLAAAHPCRPHSPHTAEMSDTKDAAAAEGKTGVAEPVYPEMPPFVARPDKTAHQQALSVLDEEIKTLTQKRTKLQTAVRTPGGGGDVREARSALMVKMRELTTQAKALRKEKGALLDQRNAFWDEQKRRGRLKKMRDELGKYTDVAGIEAAIQRLHYRQSTVQCR